MIRKMRRFKQEMPAEECIELLKTQVRGVLSLLGDDGYPYGLPIDYWYNEADGKLYFHGAKEGHKIDAIRGMNISMTTTAKTDEEGKALLAGFNFPFRN